MNDSKETLKNMDEKQEVSTYSNKVKTSDILKKLMMVCCVCAFRIYQRKITYMLKIYMN